MEFNENPQGSEKRTLDDIVLALVPSSFIILNIQIIIQAMKEGSPKSWKEKAIGYGIAIGGELCRLWLYYSFADVFVDGELYKLINKPTIFHAFDYFKKIYDSSPKP